MFHYPVCLLPAWLPWYGRNHLHSHQLTSHKTVFIMCYLHVITFGGVPQGWGPCFFRYIYQRLKGPQRLLSKFSLNDLSRPLILWNNLVDIFTFQTTSHVWIIPLTIKTSLRGLLFSLNDVLIGKHVCLGRSLESAFSLPSGHNRPCQWLSIYGRGILDRELPIAAS